MAFHIASATSGLIRHAVLDMDEYVPVTSLEHLSEELGIPIDRLVKLDGNENPYGCHPFVREAIASYEHVHIYPDPAQSDMRTALARYVGLDKEYIVGGAGGDELIDLIARLVVDPGDEVIDCVPTFAMYAFSTQLCGGHVREVPRRPDFSVDVPAVLAALTPRTKAIFLASPNNPSANLAPEDDVLQLLDAPVLVVVDEAYFEFSRRSVARHVVSRENLVVVRTFSKWAGLAGLRVGYALCHPNVSRHLWKMKPPYNVNAVAQAAVCAAIDHLSDVQSRVQAILDERPRLLAALQSIAYLEPLPTDANFIYCNVTGRDARAIRDTLRAQGILIRYFDRPLLRNAIRVSVGTSRDTARLVEALQRL